MNRLGFLGGCLEREWRSAILVLSRRTGRSPWPDSRSRTAPASRERPTFLLPSPHTGWRRTSPRPSSRRPRCTEHAGRRAERMPRKGSIRGSHVLLHRLPARQAIPFRSAPFHSGASDTRARPRADPTEPAGDLIDLRTLRGRRACDGSAIRVPGQVRPQRRPADASRDAAFASGSTRQRGGVRPNDASRCGSVRPRRHGRRHVPATSSLP